VITLLQHAQGKVGVLKGARVCAFITQWTMTSQALGREITIEDYIEWWRESQRTAYRHQAEFRAVFAPLSNPQPIANQAITRAEAVAHGVKGVGSLPASLIPA
jgi:hypothetical protein